jgi:hypothetical protein
MKPDEIFSKGREDRKVKARSLMCFWAARELGMSHTSLAKKLEMSLAGVGFSVERGESIAKKAIIHLKDKLLNFKRVLPGLVAWLDQIQAENPEAKLPKRSKT